MIKLKFICLCTNVQEYYKIKALGLSIDKNSLDIQEKDDYAIFDIENITIDNIKDIANIVDDLSSLINLQFEVNDEKLYYIKIKHYMACHNLHLDIDNDVENWLTLQNCYVDSNLKVGDIINICKL